jgi:hypothetical protein
MFFHTRVTAAVEGGLKENHTHGLVAGFFSIQAPSRQLEQASVFLLYREGKVRVSERQGIDGHSVCVSCALGREGLDQRGLTVQEAHTNSNPLLPSAPRYILYIIALHQMACQMLLN